MMRTRLAIVPFVLLGLAAPLVCHGAGSGRLMGTVVDLEGTGIPGVSVKITSPDVPEFTEVVTTDKRGVIKLKLAGEAWYRYLLEKDGYQTLTGEKRYDGSGTQLLEFLMYSEGESVPEEAVRRRGGQITRLGCFRVGEVRHLEGLHDSFVYARCQAGEHYLLAMAGACFGLKGAPQISVTGASDRICSGSRAVVVYKDLNNLQRPCPIDRVEAVDDQAEAEFLVEDRTEPDQS